ncbi:ABC transporter permease [bacterium]|jgi:lipopolysaccharide transport system permease protein|nr:ABC transporter permease [Gammaproteobacteria bacterium]MDC0559195.1 ABC transporter permease [bacterium]
MTSQRIWGLITFKVYAELKAESNRTYAGYLWWVFEPLLFMAVYYFVFGVLFGRNTEDFVPFLLVGVTIWHWIQSSISHSASAISQNRPIISQVVVPKYVFPTVAFINNSLKFLVIVGLLLFFLVFYGFVPTERWFGLVTVLGAASLFVLGSSFLVSAVIPLVPDLKILLDNGLRAMMFMSGIFFDIANLGQQWQDLLRLNPVAVIVEQARLILLRNEGPYFYDLAYVSAVGLVLLILGATLLKLFDHQYAKAPW